MKNEVPMFLRQLRSEKFLSVNTIASYKRDINEFFSWYANSELEELNDRAIKYFVNSLAEKQSPATITRKLSSLRQLFDYLVDKNILLTNPAANIKSPKKKQVLPKSLSVDDMSNMLDKKSINMDLTNPLLCRDYAIIELFYSTGMRLSELSVLDYTDLEITNSQIHILGKGNKERIVLIGEKAKTAILNWLYIRNDFIKDDKPTQALFLGKNGTRLTNRSIQLRIKEWANKLGINVDLHPHMLRHSFASHMLQSSGELRAVQEMLGHTSISSTQIYTHLDFQNLAKVYDKSHPRAKKNKD